MQVVQYGRLAGQEKNQQETQWDKELTSNMVFIFQPTPNKRCSSCRFRYFFFLIIFGGWVVVCFLYISVEMKENMVGKLIVRDSYKSSRKKMPLRRNDQEKVIYYLDTCYIITLYKVNFQILLFKLTFISSFCTKGLACTFRRYIERKELLLNILIIFKIISKVWQTLNQPFNHFGRDCVCHDSV